MQRRRKERDDVDIMSCRMHDGGGTKNAMKRRNSEY